MQIYEKGGETMERRLIPRRTMEELWERPFKILKEFEEAVAPIFRDRYIEEVWSPTMDIVEKKDEYQYIFELPGMDKKDIKIQLRGDELTVSGEKNIYKTEKDDVCHRTEVFQGKFYRKIRLPEDVDTKKVKAEYKDGVLTLHIKKSKTALPREIEIEVN